MFFFFFDEVEDFLKESLNASRGETYEKNKTIGNTKLDFFLPQGCLRLNYPPNTVIESINTLRSGSVYHARRIIKDLKKECNIRAYYIFCDEVPSPNYVPFRSSVKTNDGVHVISFRELQQRKKLAIEYDDYWKDRQSRIREKAQDSFIKGRNTFFLGAGVSKSVGLPGWDELLGKLLDNLKQRKAISINDISACRNDSIGNLLIKARYLKQCYDESHLSMVSDMRDILYKDVGKNNKLINALVTLIQTGKIESVITYNYDDVLEEALHRKGVLHTPVDSSNRPLLGTLPVLHTHGFIPRQKDIDYDQSVVLSEEDYHKLYMDSFHWANVEQLHALAQTTCYFVGLSLKDPSLRRLLDIAASRGTGNATHYAYLLRKEYAQPTKAETIYYNMGINVIWYEDFLDLPNLLRSLNNS